MRRLLAILLSISLSGLPAMAADQTAGHITALIPAATRNQQPAEVKDTLEWNDLLQTTSTGRLRAGLNDGSILSLGSNGELRVVQHDAATQQTSLELNYGKLRSRVVKITQPNGKYEVKTPNAVIGVIGTDFYVAFENGRTTVICYAGQVTVTTVGAQVLQKSVQAQTQGQQTTLSAHQTMVVGNQVPPTGFPPESSMIQTSIQDTVVTAGTAAAPAAGFVALHPILAQTLLLGVVAGAVGSVAGVAATGSSKFNPPATIPPPVVCGANSRAKCGQ